MIAGGKQPRWWQRAGAMAFAALLLLLFAGGCDGGKDQGSKKTPAAVVGPEHRFAINVGGQPVNLRLAIHDSERSRGLMNVPSMPENEGMLFVWEKPRQMSFFMRNCSFPQDIGFFNSAGVLREVQPMYPGVEDSVVSQGQDLQLALEMNQGWFRRHGVLPGAGVDLVAVRAALRDRGYDPEKYFPEK